MNYWVMGNLACGCGEIDLVPWCAVTGLHGLMRTNWVNLFPILFSGFTLVAWNHSRWEYLHYGNWQTLWSRIPSIYFSRTLVILSVMIPIKSFVFPTFIPYLVFAISSVEGRDHILSSFELSTHSKACNSTSICLLKESKVTSSLNLQSGSAVCPCLI